MPCAMHPAAGPRPLWKSRNRIASGFAARNAPASPRPVLTWRIAAPSTRSCPWRIAPPRQSRGKSPTAGGASRCVWCSLEALVPAERSALLPGACMRCALHCGRENSRCLNSIVNGLSATVSGPEAVFGVPSASHRFEFFKEYVAQLQVPSPPAPQSNSKNPLLGCSAYQKSLSFLMVIGRGACYAPCGTEIGCGASCGSRARTLLPSRRRSSTTWTNCGTTSACCLSARHAMSGTEMARLGRLAMDDQYDAMIRVQNTATPQSQPHPLSNLCPEQHLSASTEQGSSVVSWWRC
eukprot:2903833-Rhodomonas_salina.1